MRNRNARKTWRIWQPCLYAYCLTLNNSVDDKHMNVLALKLLDVSLPQTYLGGIFSKLQGGCCCCSSLLNVSTDSSNEKNMWEYCCFVSPAQEPDCSREPLMNVYHKIIARRLGNTNLMLFNRLIRAHTSAISL